MIMDIYDNLTARLRAAGDYVWPLALRAILFWEFLQIFWLLRVARRFLQSCRKCLVQKQY